MTKTSAKIAFSLLHQLVYVVKTRGGNKDTYILNHLMDAFHLMKKEYPFLEEEENKLNRIV